VAFTVWAIVDACHGYASKGWARTQHFPGSKNRECPIYLEHWLIYASRLQLPTNWQRLEFFDPNGQKIFDARGSGSVGRQGVTELFFESAEPSFDEQSLEELFSRFPSGHYPFKGTTVDGQTLNGKATLKQIFPPGPK
jgi:hypothetical protein